MKIKIKGYKNIIDLDYVITDKKTNVLYGLSGSGKSSISEALMNDENPLNKTINYSGNKIVEINGANPESYKITIFNESKVDNYLIDKENRNSNIFTILVDDDNEFQKMKSKLVLEISKIKAVLYRYDKIYTDLSNLQKKTGAELSVNKNQLKPASPINKIKKQLTSIANSNIYKEISGLNKKYFDWLVSGTEFPQFDTNACPFCEKKMNQKLKNKYKKYSVFDSKSVSGLQLSSAETAVLGVSVKHTLRSINQVEKRLINIGVALREFNVIKSQIEELDEENINTLKPLTMSEESFLFFKGLKREIKKINKRIIDINVIYQEMKTNTKLLLSGKVVYVNNLLKNFGLPYAIKAEYKKARIDSYVLYHIDDKTEIDRTESLSYGEKRIFALIMFILEEIKGNSDLIIFDDPVSSYDDSRKFSIFNFIINNLKNKTLLIFSHEQSFAKFSTHSKQLDLIGDVSYFENYDGTPRSVKITKNDFNNIEKYIRERIIKSTTYIQTIVNLRYYYEIKKTNFVYSYLSDIIHRKPIKVTYATKKTEHDVLMKIKKDHGILLPKFNDSYYNQLDVSNFEFIEKALIMRELSTTKENRRLHSELSYYIHLNGKELITLDPYKFKCVSKYVYDAVNALPKHIEYK